MSNINEDESKYGEWINKHPDFHLARLTRIKLLAGKIPVTEHEVKFVEYVNANKGSLNNKWPDIWS